MTPAYDDLPALMTLMTGDEKHGGRRRVGGGQSRRRVEEPGAGDDERHSEAAAGSRVAVGHVGGRLLVPRGDEAEPGLVAEGGDGAVELHAGQSEDDPRALLD